MLNVKASRSNFVPAAFGFVLNYLDNCFGVKMDLVLWIG